VARVIGLLAAFLLAVLPAYADHGDVGPDGLDKDAVRAATVGAGDHGEVESAGLDLDSDLPDLDSGVEHAGALDRGMIAAPTKPTPGDERSVTGGSGGGETLPATTSEVIVPPALALGFLLIGLGLAALLVRKRP
jgi:hypothetical protein